MPRLPFLNGDDTQVVVDRAATSSEYPLRLHPAILLASTQKYRLFSLSFPSLVSAVSPNILHKLVVAAQVPYGYWL